MTHHLLELLMSLELSFHIQSSLAFLFDPSSLHTLDQEFRSYCCNLPEQLVDFYCSRDQSTFLHRFQRSSQCN